VRQRIEGEAAELQRGVIPLFEGGVAVRVFVGNDGEDQNGEQQDEIAQLESPLGLAEVSRDDREESTGSLASRYCGGYT
jgi:hypothetical protein